MFWGTHICLPLLVGMGCDALVATGDRKAPFSRIDYLLIAAAGVLPDIVNPHIYLTDRLASWSHTVWFALAFAVGAGVAVRAWRRPLGLRLWSMLTLAVALHIACDGISGGVRPFHPLWPTTVGGYYVPSSVWIPLDAVIVSATVLAWRLSRRWRRPADRAGDGGVGDK